MIEEYLILLTIMKWINSCESIAQLNNTESFYRKRFEKPFFEKNKLNSDSERVSCIRRDINNALFNKREEIIK